MLLEPGAHWTVRRELVCYIDPVHDHVTLCLSHTNLGSASLCRVEGLIVPIPTLEDRRSGLPRRAVLPPRVTNSTPTLTYRTLDSGSLGFLAYPVAVRTTVVGTP